MTKTLQEISGVPANVLAALKAYQEGTKIDGIDLGYGVLYRWIDRLGIPKRGRRADYRKLKPDPHVAAALEEYQHNKAEKIEDICKRLGVDQSVLHAWVNRLGIKKRRWLRMTGKPGRPSAGPFVRECAYNQCRAELSEYQIKRRRKYCCRECQDKGIAAAALARARDCPAPGCEGKIFDDSPFCSWACFQATMKGKFG